MKTQMDNFLEAQKKAWEFWTDSSKKAMDQFNEWSGKEKDPGQSLLEIYKKQQQLWEESMKVDNWKDAFENAPEKLQRWASLQQDLAQTWMKFYTENADKFGAQLKGVNGFGKNPFTYRPNGDWKDWLEQSNQFIRNGLMAKMPFPQNFHYENFLSIYDTMIGYWDSLRQMIQYGMSNQEALDAFFKPEAYRKMMGQFMGFQPIEDLADMMEEINGYFEEYTGVVAHFFNRSKEEQNRFFKQWSQSFKGQLHPLFESVLDMNQTIQEGMDSMYLMAGDGKEVEVLRLIKDIQFAYMAYVLKTADLQNQVFQAGQFALPDAIKAAHKQFQQADGVPNYQEFFDLYVNILEKYMLEVLDSNDYSELQSEVAKVGITVKSKMDDLVELVFSDFPFLMQSHADEVAMETRALRQKVRGLEARLADLEKGKTTVTGPATDPQSALFAAIGQASEADRDDLKEIKGVGPKLETMLNKLGIYSFEQVSKMTSAQYALLDQLLTAFQGRAERDDWAGQAKQLI